MEVEKWRGWGGFAGGAPLTGPSLRALALRGRSPFQAVTVMVWAMW